MEDNKITPGQRAELFSKATRKYVQPIPAQAGAANGVVSFQIPKARLLSNITLLCEAELTVTHTSATTVTSTVDGAPYTCVKNIRVELNNGFAPYNISGRMAYLSMIKRQFGSLAEPLIDTQTNVAAARRRAKMGTTASVAGTANTVQFVIDLPTMLNERDPIGLIMLQNEATVATVTVTLGQASDLAVMTGGTVAIGNITVSPLIETFSIPDPKVAPMPDLSVIKLVQESTETISGAGSKVVKLPVGNTYRSLMFRIDDGTNAVTDASLTGEFELVFNTADINLRISSKQLAALNAKQYGVNLPKGVYILDFGYQGLANLGGFRDYIDTQRLTEFWLRFTAGASGNITYVSEQLSQLAYA